MSEEIQTNYPNKEKFEKEAKKWLEKKKRKPKNTHPWHKNNFIKKKEDGE